MTPTSSKARDDCLMSIRSISVYEMCMNTTFFEPHIESSDMLVLESTQ